MKPFPRIIERTEQLNYGRKQNQLPLPVKWNNKQPVQGFDFINFGIQVAEQILLEIAWFRMCCCVILFSGQWRWSVSTHSLKVEPIGLFPLKLLETRGCTLWELGFAPMSKISLWERVRSTQKCECPSMFTFPKTQKSHASKRNYCSHFWRLLSFFFSFGCSTVIIFRNTSLSFCDYPRGTDLFLTWFCCLKNRLDNTSTFAYLSQVHTVYTDIRGQFDNLPTTYILHDWQLT